MRYQLLSAGYSEAGIEQALVRLQQLLLKTLNHEELKAIFANPQVQFEWPLHDVNGKLLVMDLVVPHDNYWQVIDYKSSQRRPDESLEAFKARMCREYRPQLQSYCNYLQAIDGKAAKASLFLIEEGVLLEVIG